jgi:hypothetical protein
METTEERRLQEARDSNIPWKKWGPYLSERQWGTVREDYSQTGNAWDYFPHDQARSRAYRWGEDGLAGVSDDQQFLCFALALWNGKDPILKERLFGLTNSEGNHGEDVKEYYFYLDSTPTHSYMKYLYKYPQAAYPYEDLVKTNRQRNRLELEYELINTGVFDDDRYFDVFVEYAKHSPEELLIRISVWNRGPAAAALHVLPTLWFRNTWSWSKNPSQKPILQQHNDQTIAASHPDYVFTVDGHGYRVDYEPAESSTGLFGGNSNWRGPIWLPVNLLLIQSLRKMYSYYGNEFTVECPTGSGRHMNLWEVANEIARRLCNIFLRDGQGRRPVYGNAVKFQTDPHWRDLLLFYEYFHGDNGAGVGASHQTGWTGLVAWLLMSPAVLDPKEVLEKGFDAAALKIV